MHAVIKSHSKVALTGKCPFQLRGGVVAADISVQHVVLLNLDLGHLARVHSHLLSCCKFVWFKLKLFVMYPQLHITAYCKQTLERIGLWPFSVVSLCSMWHGGHVLPTRCCDVGHITGKVGHITGKVAHMGQQVCGGAFPGGTVMVQENVFAGCGAGSNPHWEACRRLQPLSLIGITLIGC